MIRNMMRLELFADINFSGRRIVFRNGQVAVRDIRAFLFNDQLSSFRVRTNMRNVTLVLFADVNYQGNFLVFRGPQAVADLRMQNFNDQMSSFVFVRGNLTNADIQSLQRRGRAPQGILEIFNTTNA
jgi:hypothetical protein